MDVCACQLLLDATLARLEATGATAPLSPALLARLATGDCDVCALKQHVEPQQAVESAPRPRGLRAAAGLA